MSATSVQIADEVVTLLNENSPFAASTQTGTLTSGSASVTGLSDTTNLIPGQVVAGTGVPTNTTIESIDSLTSITLSANATANGTPALTFAAQFTAVRKYAPILDRQQLSTLKVSVVADSPTIERLSRDRIDGQYPIDIALQKALNSAEDLDEIDPITTLLERLYLFALSDDTAGNSRCDLPGSQATLSEVSYKTLCDPKHLREQKIFTGVITLNYKLSTVIR